MGILDVGAHRRVLIQLSRSDTFTTQTPHKPDHNPATQLTPSPNPQKPHLTEWSVSLLPNYSTIAAQVADIPVQPTEFELRQRNQQFANKARAGKNPVNQSRKEKLEKRSPISVWALGMVAFVLLGGGASDSTDPIGSYN